MQHDGNASTFIQRIIDCDGMLDEIDPGELSCLREELNEWMRTRTRNLKQDSNECGGTQSRDGSIAC